MKTYLIYSKSETSRQSNIERLLGLLPKLELVEAIYPLQQKVPFLEQAMAISKQRTGQALLPGEVGCLLSHRAIWRMIAQVGDTNDDAHFLILESDSYLKDLGLIQSFASSVTKNYDLFFWGAWDGHMQLFRKSKKNMGASYEMGTPFIKTIYCTYGYSLNKKTAKLLLKRTGKFSYPVDQYKRFMKQRDVCIGGIQPELISTTGAHSNIRAKRKWEILNQLYLMVLDLKNYLICLLK